MLLVMLNGNFETTTLLMRNVDNLSFIHHAFLHIPPLFVGKRHVFSKKEQDNNKTNKI
jgi:hypothetical protein